MVDLRRARRRLRLALLRHRATIAAALAAAAVLAALHTLAPPDPPTVTVVAAALDLSAGQTLGRSDLSTVEVPARLAPDDAARATEEVVGRTVAGPVGQGEILTRQRLVGPSLVAGYPGTVAAPVRIADAGSVALLRVGDRIDVYAARPHSTRARVVVTGAPVVSLPEPAGSGGDALVVLAVETSQAAALAQAAATSSLTLTITGPGVP